jgi:hypothetical protein
MRSNVLKARFPLEQNSEVEYPSVLLGAKDHSQNNAIFSRENVEARWRFELPALAVSHSGHDALRRNVSGEHELQAALPFLPQSTKGRPFSTASQRRT